jgi:NAD(P)-dependent dehydrogenase (short-subunit alcohol dehydrogenase family)
MIMTREPSVSELFDLHGKTAMVTGASGYLGGALARAVAEAGATVVVTSRNRSRAEEVASRLPRVPNSTHIGIELDHLDEDSIARALDRAVELAGKLDILVNNGHDRLADDLTTVSGAQFTQQLANATGYFLLSRKLRDHIVGRAGQGSIIMLGSMYGMVSSYPDAYQGLGPASPVAYQCLKGGIIQMTRHLAVYWAKDGVRVNCISPGPFPPAEPASEIVERLSSKVPMGRMGSPHELKGAVVFLASDASSYVTGHNLIVDGGWTAW